MFVNEWYPQMYASTIEIRIMKKVLIMLIAILNMFRLSGQTTDTLKFFSESFQSERTVYVETPEFYKYQSDSVNLPAIYLLDGQHEWFINPVRIMIKYLQYTHQIPQAVIVIIPLEDRNTECQINGSSPFTVGY